MKNLVLYLVASCVFCSLVFPESSAFAFKVEGHDEDDLGFEEVMEVGMSSDFDLGEEYFMENDTIDDNYDMFDEEEEFYGAEDSGTAQ